MILLYLNDLINFLNGSKNVKKVSIDVEMDIFCQYEKSQNRPAAESCAP